MGQERLFSQDGGRCDILTVHAERKDYAVAAPAYQADTGMLVEFRVADNMTLVGKVVSRMQCTQFDEAWQCISKFTRIHEAVNIFLVSWSEDTETS